MQTDWSGVSSAFLDYLVTDDATLCRELIDPLLLDLLKPAGKTLLDVGCGEGHFSRLLKSVGAARVVGVDISPDLVKQAEAADPSGEYRVSDIVSVSSVRDVSPLTFDGAVANLVMMYVSDLDASYRSIAEILAPAGKFVVCIVNPYYGTPVGHWEWALPAAPTDRNVEPRDWPAETVLQQASDVLNRQFSYGLRVSNYFESRIVHKTFGRGTETVPHIHRQLSDYINLAARHGLTLGSLLEPHLSPELQQRFSALPLTKALTTVPLFLILVFNKGA